MAEIIIGESLYDDIYTKAYWAKHSLDRSSRHFDLEDAAYECADYLKIRQKNRTLSDIAYAEVIRKNPISNDVAYSKNIKALESVPEADILLKEARTFNHNNYPKTGKIRNLLIFNNRFRLYEVLPKLTGFSKFAMKYLK